MAVAGREKTCSCPGENLVLGCIGCLNSVTNFFGQPDSNVRNTFFPLH